MYSFQQELLGQVQQEVLAQGSSEFVAWAEQFCAFYETQASKADSASTSVQRDQLPNMIASGQFLSFDESGTPSPGIELEPAVAALLPQSLVGALYEKAKRGEERNLTIDNHRAYFDGSADVPAIIQLRAIPDESSVIGVAQTQNLDAIRVDSLAQAGAAESARMMRQRIGLFVVLVLLTLSLAWLALHLVLFRPLVNTFSYAGIGSATAGLTWADLKEYACHLREVSDQKESIRAKLETETEIRFQAEEDRDKLRNQLDHALDKFEKAIEARYEVRLQDAQSQLMRREARALKRYVQEPLVAARAAAAEQGAAEQGAAQPLLETLDKSIDSVRSLAEEGESISHAAQQVSLQPWLEGVVQRFSEEHGAEITTSIQNGVQIQIDPASLENALRFVMENALHASAPESAIAVDALPVGESVEIRIIDRGTGIDGSAREHILVPFYTMSEDRDGLGLAITRSVIRRHGGSLAIRSESDKGTAVIITVPNVAAGH